MSGNVPMTATKILAIDIGGSKLLTALVDVRNAKEQGLPKISGQARRELGRNIGKKELLTVIRSAVDETLKLTSVDWDAISAIGATIPGVADPKRGYWIYAPFSGIRDFALGDELQCLYKKRVFADNDVNACAWGEKVFGVCHEVENYLWVTISNGIGGGLVLNGQIYPGRFSGAAEIGHFNVVPGGYSCGCGNHGCLETVAAGPGIVHRYYDYISLFNKNSLANEEQVELKNGYVEYIKTQKSHNGDVQGNELLTAAALATEARNGNPLARLVFHETGCHLGRAFAWAANLINPEKIVVGGGVVGAFDLFYPSMWKVFQENLFKQVNQSLCIAKTALGYEAGLLGATAIAFEFPYSGLISN